MLIFLKCWFDISNIVEAYQFWIDILTNLRLISYKVQHKSNDEKIIYQLYYIFEQIMKYTEYGLDFNFVNFEYIEQITTRSELDCDAAEHINIEKTTRKRKYNKKKNETSDKKGI